MAKSQIIELKDGVIMVNTYKNGVHLASAAPNIELTPDGFVMGCTITTHEAMTFLRGAFDKGGKIQEGYVIKDNRASEKIQAEDLEKVLTRWEGAVSACERDGDDSLEAERELTDSRAALLSLLKKALAAGTLSGREINH